MPKDNLRITRVVSSIAALLISLACGTNYVYSAWGPQFAEKLKFSSTQQNLIGISANLGMYSLGIPIGLFVDAKGVRITAICGGIFLGVGYFSLRIAYQRGSGYLPLLCIFSFFTGFGGCAAFTAAIKVSAMNWPHHRGTATAFPLAAFGLSAFLFSFIGRLLISGDTSNFLMLLSAGTFGLVTIGFLFLKVVPSPNYLSGNTTLRSRSDSNQYHKDESGEPRSSLLQAFQESEEGAVEEAGFEAEEASTLLPKVNPVSCIVDQESHSKDHAQYVDIRGLRILKTVEFWQLFGLMTVLAGSGLMTINNLGNDIKALSRYWHQSMDEKSVIKREAVQVSILSVCSFVGRIASGVGSDFLVKVLKASRLWCLVLASVIFLVAQLSALIIQDPHLLFLVSGPTGLGYGFLYGCFPSLLAETFGIRGLSQNWGTMILSSMISGNTFNLAYGMIYDKHSITSPNGYRECVDGLSCYQQAYFISTVACTVGVAGSLWSVWYAHSRRHESIVSQEEQDV